MTDAESCDADDDTATYRRYTISLGRWLSPDPLGGDITNPQSLNRYAYALNNPTNMVDPLGLGPNQPCVSSYEGSYMPGLQTGNCGTPPNAASGPADVTIDSNGDPLSADIGQAEAAYDSWVDAEWQTRGSYIIGTTHGPLTYTVGWSVESGAYWIGTHAECGPSSGDYQIPIHMEILAAVAEAEESRNSCTDRTSPRPINMFGAGDLCTPQHHTFEWAWTCRGGDDCCFAKEDLASRNCETEGRAKGRYWYLESGDTMMVRYANCCDEGPLGGRIIGVSTTFRRR